MLGVSVMLKKSVRELAAKAVSLVCEPCFDTQDVLIEAAAREHAAAALAAEKVLRKHADSDGLVAMFARNSRRWSPPLAKAIAAAEKAVHDLVERETAGA
jgi:hypothetical protein